MGVRRAFLILGLSLSSCAPRVDVEPLDTDGLPRPKPELPHTSETVMPAAPAPSTSTGAPTPGRCPSGMAFLEVSSPSSTTRSICDLWRARPRFRRSTFIVCSAGCSARRRSSSIVAYEWSAPRICCSRPTRASRPSRSAPATRRTSRSRARFTRHTASLRRRSSGARVSALNPLAAFVRARRAQRHPF